MHQKRKHEVKLFTGDGLKRSNDWQGTAYETDNLVYTNEVLGKFTIQASTAPAFEKGILDLRRIRNFYVSASNLSTFKTLRPREENGIIKKCPVTADCGFTLTDNAVSRDWIAVSKQLLKTLEFRLSDAYGTTTAAQGMRIMFKSCWIRYGTMDGHIDVVGQRRQGNRAEASESEGGQIPCFIEIAEEVV